MGEKYAASGAAHSGGSGASLSGWRRAVRLLVAERVSQAGETEEAILMYKKCLAQNPENDFAKDQIERLEA
jgi:hypothetical protein